MFSRRVITASRQAPVLLRMRAPHCNLLVTVWCLVSGLLLLLGGLLALFLFTPLVNLIIQSKVVLLPGTDVAEAWIAPPIRPLLKIYYFNATNAEVCRIGYTILITVIMITISIFSVIFS